MLRDVRKEFLARLRAVVNREVGVVDGARLLSSLGVDLDVDLSRDKDFLLVTGIASEADEYPLPHARHLWAPEALAGRDEGQREFERLHEQRLLDAAAGLLRKLAAD